MIKMIMMIIISVSQFIQNSVARRKGRGQGGDFCNLGRPITAIIDLAPIAKVCWGGAGEFCAIPPIMVIAVLAHYLGAP